MRRFAQTLRQNIGADRNSKLGQWSNGQAEVQINEALVHSTGPGMVNCSSLSGSSAPMPHKHNADRRHHIPKMSFRVRNWPAYEAGLRRRGSLTLWIEDAALECWQTLDPTGRLGIRTQPFRPA